MFKPVRTKIICTWSWVPKSDSQPIWRVVKADTSRCISFRTPRILHRHSLREEVSTTASAAGVSANTLDSALLGSYQVRVGSCYACYRMLTRSRCLTYKDTQNSPTTQMQRGIKRSGKQHLAPLLSSGNICSFHISFHWCCKQKHAGSAVTSRTRLLFLPLKRRPHVHPHLFAYYCKPFQKKRQCNHKSKHLLPLCCTAWLEYVSDFILNNLFVCFCSSSHFTLLAEFHKKPTERFYTNKVTLVELDKRQES